MTTNNDFANAIVTIAELGNDPETALRVAAERPVAILNGDRTAAYLIAADVFEAMIEALEDAELAEVVKRRRGGPARKISLDEL